MICFVWSPSCYFLRPFDILRVTKLGWLGSNFRRARYSILLLKLQQDAQAPSVGVITQRRKLTAECSHPTKFKQI